ncbi:MAG: RNHCP domain-containing protein [Candidatus Kaiserbacteria bacterium]|nr:RNHCP domain-containing protein [Candidatus Kaiserbacteria bacterium]
MKRFQRTVEDFTCEHCGASVKGDGYTNHCTQCLWSKHVDINPGDRANACGGLMRPIRIEGSTPDYFLIHECVRCEKQSRNIFGKADNMETLLSIAKTVAEGKVAKRLD